MNIKLVSEEQILNIEFRKKIISEIQGGENQNRKREMVKRHEIYRDKTSKYVIENLIKENLEPATIQSMMNRAGNISICRKIINKLARCYMVGVIRTAEYQEDQSKIDDMSRLLCFDTKMKKSDRYRQLFKNNMPQVIPEFCETIDGVSKYKIKLRILAPWQYDVVEDFFDHEKPKVIIMSDFYNTNEGDHIDQIIADNPSDSETKSFIWWTEHYHFTTTLNGDVIASKSPEDLLNPIQELPFANVTDDQDGEFWARGGEDITDGSILVNTLLTDMFSIAYLQGYGQLVVTGKDIPEKLKVGPHKALVINYDEGDPKPEADYRSASPPLEMWMKSIEQYVALMLSTNGLSPSSVAGALNAANSFPSGIALLVEQSEATENIEDKQKQFMEVERELWDAVIKWQNLLFSKGALEDEFMAIGEIKEQDISVKFLGQKPIVTEAEKLANIKIREELGLNSKIELLQLDNPDLTKDEAEQKLKEIMGEKLNSISSAMSQAIKGGIQNGQEKIKEEGQ